MVYPILHRAPGTHPARERRGGCGAGLLSRDDLTERQSYGSDARFTAATMASPGCAASTSAPADRIDHVVVVAWPVVDRVPAAV